MSVVSTKDFVGQVLEPSFCLFWLSSIRQYISQKKNLSPGGTPPPSLHLVQDSHSATPLGKSAQTGMGQMVQQWIAGTTEWDGCQWCCNRESQRLVQQKEMEMPAQRNGTDGATKWDGWCNWDGRVGATKWDGQLAQRDGTDGATGWEAGATKRDGKPEQNGMGQMVQQWIASTTE